MRIIGTTPTRISLFGGGTDTDPFASLYGGFVLSIAINLRQKMTLQRGGDWKLINQANPHFYGKIMDHFKLDDLWGLKCEFDGVIESGLGSSASAAVCLVGVINEALDLKMSVEEIAKKAWELEVKKLGLYGGKQDQYAAAYGGVNVFEFGKEVKILPLNKEFIFPLLPWMTLFYTGKNRTSTKIQEGLKELSVKQAESLNQIKELTYQGILALSKGDIEEVGRLLDESWAYKKNSNKGVTNELIDSIYTKAKDLGAIGGKILGSGGGGYMVFIVPPEKKIEFIEKLGIEYIDFSVDWTGLDVRVVSR